MFKITTRPPTSALFPSQDEIPSSHRKHPAELEGMDIDDEDMGGPSNLAGVVTPGEVITSAKEFMRYVPLYIFRGLLY
jgi:exosome complex component RRP4